MVVTIDGEEYEVDGSGSVEDALADFQLRMRVGALDALTLADGRRMLVHWGRVTAISVAATAGRPAPGGPGVPRPLWSRTAAARRG